MSFDSFNLHPAIMAGVRAAGYVTPTPIQEKCIPAVLQGRDVIGLAQTGTGKTAAFALPILQRLMTGPRGIVRALVISPTRELAEQTYEGFCQLGKATRLRAVAVYGGVGMEPQIRKIREGAEIVIACPGRLLDHLWKGNLDPSHVEVLVIDETDRMFDMGFQPSIRNILECLLNPRQTLLFSATMPPDIRKLVEEILHNPVTFQIGHTAPAVSVRHTLFPVEQSRKTGLLLALLKETETESVIVFTRTKHRTERLADTLAAKGFRVASLQGNMAQSQRQRALDGFRDGKYKILVATDIAARGLDVLSISHVINYDMPETVDDYTHRIGRTGRVDQTGDAYSFITTDNREVVRELEKVLKEKIEWRTVPGFGKLPNTAVETRKSTTGSPRPAATRTARVQRPDKREFRRPRRQASGFNKPSRVPTTPKPLASEPRQQTFTPPPPAEVKPAVSEAKPKQSLLRRLPLFRRKNAVGSK